MKSKLHFGILLLVIAFVIRFVDQTAVPNQQIVIQFSDAEMTQEGQTSTLENIADKLRVLGAEDIQIGKDDFGNLKITYYSSTSIEHIKDLLDGNAHIPIFFELESYQSEKTSSGKTSKKYKLDISEISKKGNTNNSDFNGIEVVELNQKSDRFNQLNKQSALSDFDSVLIYLEVKHSQISTYNNGYANNLSYLFPEVRAGPLS